MLTRKTYRIAILGGTGAEGRGLALRWASAGHAVAIGSRLRDRARDVAEELSRRIEGGHLRGASNEAVAHWAELVVLTLPYAARRDIVAPLVARLSGKLVVDATVPLRPPHVSVVHLPQGGSAAAELQAELGTDIRVVSAFQNVAAESLDDLDATPDCDVMVSADRDDDAALVCGLVRDAGMNALHVGPLANAIVAEALTSVLIGLNRRHRTRSAGIRFTGPLTRT